MLRSPLLTDLTGLFYILTEPFFPLFRIEREGKLKRVSSLQNKVFDIIFVFLALFFWLLSPFFSIDQ